MTLLISTPAKEGVYQASKWLKFQVLCSEEELRSLFAQLDPFWIFPLTGIVDGKPFSQEMFLNEYGRWIEGLKRGVVPSDAEIRKVLACAFTDDLGALWLQEIAGKGYLTKISQPTVQVQSHYFTYSSEDGEFRPMSMGMGSIFWGLQFSYPQIYQDAKTSELKTAPDNRLFETLRLWVRETTRATPFLVDGKRVNSSIRIGKTCLSWAQLHPQLIARNIGIFHGS